VAAEPGDTVRYDLAYGRTTVPLTARRDRVIACLDVADAPPLGRTPAEIAPHVLAALRSPIASPPLAEVVRPGERVVVVVNDQTRMARTEMFLPVALDELNRAGVPDDAITCLFALGAHRALSRDEMVELVGVEAAARVKLVNHDCRDDANLVLVGRTTRGNDVRVNRLLVDADRIVLTGSIVYHFFAGFGGGRKAVVPGCAGLSTIQFNHAMMLDPAATIGRLDGNPVHADLLEGAGMLAPDFLLNVVLNDAHEIAGIVAGDMVAAHRRGCEFVEGLYGVPLAARADLVVASCGGWPKDINVYQAQKTMDNAIAAVRQGGVVIVLAECPEGAGNDTYLRWMRRYRTPEAIAEATRTNFQLGGHKAYAVTRLLQHAEIIMVSKMKPDDVAELLLTPAASLDEAMAMAGKRLGPSPSIVVMPQGGLTLPRCNA
jgi:nickel-dependent lactate racemase